MHHQQGGLTNYGKCVAHDAHAPRGLLPVKGAQFIIGRAQIYAACLCADLTHACTERFPQLLVIQPSFQIPSSYIYRTDRAIAMATITPLEGRIDRALAVVAHIATS